MKGRSYAEHINILAIWRVTARAKDGSRTKDRDQATTARATRRIQLPPIKEAIAITAAVVKSTTRIAQINDEGDPDPGRGRGHRREGDKGGDLVLVRGSVPQSQRILLNRDTCVSLRNSHVRVRHEASSLNQMVDGERKVQI